MSENRIRRTAVAAALVAGAWGAFSTARAQASGTLQASVTVIDDAVSRAVTAEIPGYLSAPVGSSGIRRRGMVAHPHQNGSSRRSRGGRRKCLIGSRRVEEIFASAG